MVRDDPKLLDDSGEVPKLNGVDSSSIFSCEILSLLDENISHVVKRLMCFKKRNGLRKILYLHSPKCAKDFTY